ncbi:MAG: nuclear transport factor 2 family protein [Halioglobus sp.]|nr:nuclear transport factor 2 family protein [Halioglobus sp.]
MPRDYCSDHLAIQQVMLNYAAGVDERDRERYSNCFAEDVEVIGFGTQTYRGRDAWVDYVWNALTQYTATQHMLGPILATLDGERATTRSDVQALHLLAGSDERFTLWATYHTAMGLIDGQWRITRHELKVCATHSW